jgi:hypothetical protein
MEYKTEYRTENGKTVRADKAKGAGQQTAQAPADKNDKKGDAK